jgi:hypothetical protein
VLLDSMIGVVVDIELARHQWADGRRALERARPDHARYDRLSTAVEVVSQELSRRLGQVFSLTQLTDCYEASDRWVLEVIHDAFPDDPPKESSLVANAAFDLYARRASDYAP